MRRPDRPTLLWGAVGLILPASAAGLLVQARGAVPNTDIALVILATVLVVAASHRTSAVVLAAGSAALSYDFFHTTPYHSFRIANGNDVVATVVVGLLGLAIGLAAARAARSSDELVLIVAAAALSQAVPQPARLLVNHRALDACLAVLVFVTALGIPAAALVEVRHLRRRLGGAIAATTVLLPVLAWCASRLVAAGPLRGGVLAVGVAPAEIASVAVVALAGGDTAAAAGTLGVTTVITVVAAGPVLRVLGGAAPFDVAGLLGHLLLIVGLPLALGVLVRARVGGLERFEEQLHRTALALVVLLVWLVASQAHLSSAYGAVVGALLVFVAGSALLGVAVGWRAPHPVATSLLLSVSMRDFAIAAGIAVAAFGSRASAPLGVYGVLVILWGMIVAARARRRPGQVWGSPLRT